MIPIHSNSRRPLAGLVLSLSLCNACATGGDEDRPSSEVTVGANHHMFGLGGNRSIPQFPIPPTTVGTDTGVFSMTTGSSYTITRISGTSSAQAYSLAADGTLSLVVPIGSGVAPTRFVGAYRFGANMAQAYFFTDRFAPTNSPNVGFFWGTRTSDASGVPGNPQGEWFVFSQHVILSQSVFPDIDEVGRSVAGALSIVASAGNPDVVTGTGVESSGANIAFTGTASGFANDAVTLSLNYAPDTGLPGTRVFAGGYSVDLILGLDGTDNDGEIGMIALVKQRFLPNRDRTAAMEALAGTYDFGMHTIFVAPGASGIDAANGTMAFNAQGGFQLNGVGSLGPSEGAFSYTGSYEFEAVANTNPQRYSNRLVLSISGTNETWFAAVDSVYGVLVLLDNEVERTRPSNQSPELNLVLALRKPD